MYIGFQFGTICAYLFSPLLIDTVDNYSFDGWLNGINGMKGWEGMFYLYGIAGFMWLIPWWIFVKEETDNSVKISSSSSGLNRKRGSEFWVVVVWGKSMSLLYKLVE